LKSWSNNDGKFWTNTCRIVYIKAKRIIFWKGLKGTMSMKMIRVTYCPLKIKCWCVFLGQICVCVHNF
jgi:hypothetical protein